MAGCDGIASIVEKLVIAGADTAKDARVGAAVTTLLDDNGIILPRYRLGKEGRMFES